MWSKNSFQQMSLNDTVLNMPKYLKKTLYESWAQPFQEIIFPAINEDRFSILYSDKPSRPNSPVNVIIGALILKEIFQLSDEELIGSIYFDTRFQYALRLTSEEKPPVSINSFTNFRVRNYDYYEETGIDLIQEEIEDISKLIADVLEIKGNKVRVDSFMIASSCRNLSRIELIYTVNAQFIKKLNQIDKDVIPEECLVYLEEGHKNETIYKTRDKNSESKLKFLLRQAKLLYDAGLKAGSKITDTGEFKILKRMLGEQTKNDDDFDNLAPSNIEPKENNEISPDSLQNPSDPDATYRYKYGDNIGYTANLVEQFDEENGIIQTYDLKPNTYSDQQFSNDIIEKLDVEQNNNGFIQMLTDGTYFSIDLAKKALLKGIELIPGELTGRKPDDSKLSYGSTFIIDKEENIISACFKGQKPVSTNYDEEKEIYTAKFSKDTCAECDHMKQCRIQAKKKFNTVRFSRKRYMSDSIREKMDTKEYIKLANQRAGVEGLPSVFRRFYHVDRMPIRGLVKSKIWFGFKVAASNVKKLFKRHKTVPV
ncbi:MAG: transposase [Clostridia bacterium]|nr:transposase [Clostridia bacterium]